MQNEPTEVTNWNSIIPIVTVIIGAIIAIVTFLRGKNKAEAEERSIDKELKLKELELKKQEHATFVEDIVRKTVHEMRKEDKEHQIQFERKIEEKVTQQSLRIDEIFSLLNK